MSEGYVAAAEMRYVSLPKVKPQQIQSYKSIFTNKYIMEIRTNILTTAQIEAEIDEFVTFLNTKGINDLTVMYGWACNLNYKELYQEIPLATEKLKQFIVQSIENGVYKIGQCDLFIQTNQNELEFVLCHEADIHFKTTNALLFQEMKSNWQAKDYKWYEVGKT